nr:InlB B-repeat-containing protein [Clostridiales bacterium]
MKKARTLLPVLLTFMLAVSVCVSVGILIMPDAEAITTQTAGNYYIKVEVHDETSTLSKYDSCNNSAGYVVVPTIKQDGTEGPLWYATVKKSEWDSDNMTATYYYHADGKNKDASTNVAVAGFPAGLRKVQTASATATNWIKNNNGSWTSRERFRVYVSADNSNWTCVLDYYEDTSAGGNWSYTNAVESSKYPALNAVAITGPTTVLTHGSAKQTYTVTAACDQYGVNWGFSSVSWASSNSNATITGGGVATFGFNGGAAYATVFTPSLYNGSYSSVNTVAVSVNPVADTIALHETKTAAINAGNGHFFCFKPTTTGNYAFWAGGTDLDPLGFVFDAGCNELIRQDDISNSSNGNPTAQSVLGLSSGNRHYVVYRFTSNTEYFLFTNDYYNVNSGNTKTGSYPVTVSRAVDLTFNDANSGATTTFTGMPSNQPFVIADRVSFARDNHTLIAWSESGSAAETKTVMHSETLTIPATASKTYYALWYPDSPATLTPNNDYTAAVDAGAQIRFYQFTPSSTRKYLIYGKAGTDSYVNLYDAAAYRNNAGILTSQDDSGTDDGTMYGYAFDGLTYNQFFLLQQLTANTKYLYGVKFYNSSATGDLPFRFEEVYSVAYDLRGGAGTFADQDKFLNKDLTLSSDAPARAGYSFKGWSADPAGNTVDYAPGATYTGNADLTLYAVWAADPAFLNWAYTMGKSTYDNGGSGISGLGDAVANGKTILDSVNAYSDTYDQTQADAAANAILAALPEATLNSGVTVDIATPGEGYCQRFTPSASGTYIFYSYATERAGDPYGFIYSGAGAELAKQDDISSSSNGAPTMQALLGIQRNQHYVTYNMTAGTAYYLYTRCYNTSDTGTYPVMISSPVKLTFDPAGGSETVVKENVPGGAPLPLTNIAPTRAGHSLLAWSESGEADEPKAYMANGTLTVPSSDKTYFALWYPDDPAEVSLNTDHTASVTAASQIVYYSFTPSVTSNYVLYSKGVDVSVIDPAVLLYDANAYAADASYLVFDDDGGNNHHDFVGSSNRNFFVETELTAGTAYLIGVKNYRRTLGDIPFRIERVYSVTYDANNGDGAPDAQSKYYGKDLTLSSAEPTRDNYSFKGWATDSTATAAEYAAGGSYTADADAVLYAVWEINSYTVTFKDGYTGATLTTASVEHGSAAIAPTPATYHAIDGNNGKHMKFTGWDNAFDNVTGALTVTAQYAQEDHGYGTFASVDGNDHSRTCADCDYVQTEAHAWEWITDTAATCGAAGVKHQKCSICGAEQNENTPIDATGAHVWKWVTDTEPTCGAAGVKHEECENCDAVQNENTEIPATGEHVWKWVTDTEPTCGAAGVKHEECENCDAVQSENTPIDPTGAHTWKWVVDTEPTCGAAGVKHEECENCDAVRNENTPIEATGEHEFEWVVDTEATCGTDGVKHEKCKNCDAVQSENTPIEATGEHEFEWVIDTEATC